MRNTLLYILPALIVPAVFFYYLWEAGKAEGWGGWAYGALLGLVALISGVLCLALVGSALIQRKMARENWRWMVASAAVAGTPAAYALLYQIFR